MSLQTLRARTLPVVDRAAGWLAERSERERRLLAGLAALGLAAVLWYGVLQPLSAARQSAQARLDLYEELQGRLTLSSASEARAAPDRAAIAADPTEPLQVAVVRMATAQGLAAQTTEGVDQVRASLTNGRFESVVTFISDLEAAGLVADQVRLEATGQPGLVNLTLTVARP